VPVRRVGRLLRGALAPLAGRTAGGYRPVIGLLWGVTVLLYGVVTRSGVFGEGYRLKGRGHSPPALIYLRNNIVT